MYGNDFMSTSNKKQGFLAARQSRRIEEIKARVAEEYRRYEAIKSQYGWKGKKRPFVMYDDYCQIGEDEHDYSHRLTTAYVEYFVDGCEEKAKHHHKKQERKAKLHAKFVEFYGNLGDRISVLGGKVKLKEGRIKVTLPLPEEIGREEKIILDYNAYDRTFLEEKVILCEQAHQKRQEFIARQNKENLQ